MTTKEIQEQIKNVYYLLLNVNEVDSLCEGLRDDFKKELLKSLVILARDSLQEILNKSE